MYFVSRLELFSAVMQDFQQCFPLHSNRGDQGFFFYGQLTSFFYCFFRRIVPKNCLPTETDSESIHEFDVSGKTRFGLGNFMKKNQFRNSALRVAKATVVVKRGMSKKKSGAHAVISVVLEELVNPFLESARNYLKFVCHGILVRAKWKSDPVNRFGCSDYALISHLPKNRQLHVLAV